MLPSTALYPLVCHWLQQLGMMTHTTALGALAHLVTAALIAQDLTPTGLMRALGGEQPTAAARTRYQRVQDGLARPWLTSAKLTPGLVRAALALISGEQVGPLAGRTVLALDSVRLGGWEVFTLGVVWHGRALPVAWAVLPSPLPRGRFRPTVCALVRQVAAAWPAARPAVLVADRAFPSVDLFKTLRAVGWDWSVRLTARHYVTVGSQPQRVRDLLEGVCPGAWTGTRGCFAGPRHGLEGTVVVGQGLVVLPRHQANPGSLRARERRLGQRRQHAASKNQSRTAQYDRWVALFTSLPTVALARASYRRRYPIEGSYRDAQTGWDGRHGWELGQAAARLTAPESVDRLVGLWAVAALLQCWIGHAAVQPDAPPVVQRTVRSWSVTGRLSVWARGRFALTEPSGQLGSWLSAALTDGAARIAPGPARHPPVALPAVA